MDGATGAGILGEVDGLMRSGSPPDWSGLLERVIGRLGCALGTIHLVEKDGLLHLHAQKDLPPFVLEKVRTIPIGKGMAGLAAERREPVQVCNLQNEQVVVRPDAKLTKAEGSIACPMLAGGELYGVLGVAKRVAYDFTAEETALLMCIGERIAEHMRAGRG